MLHLSKVILHPQQEHNERLHDIYKLHRKLWQAFDTGDKDKSRDFLFRVDDTPNRSKIILVQSQTEPHWDNLFEREEVAVKSYQPQFKDGQRFIFYLRANAVEAKKREGKKRSVKIPICPRHYIISVVADGYEHPQYDTKEWQDKWRERKGHPEDKAGWLTKQGREYGFKLCEASRVGAAYAYGKKDNGNPIRLTGQNLRGILQITDTKKFMQVYVDGLGRGKAFGFGMLSLMKV